MRTATLTYYNSSKGFGFLTTQEGEQYFFHASNFEKNCQPVVGATVKFLVGPAIAVGKKEQALGVRYPRVDEVRA